MHHYIRSYVLGCKSVYTYSLGSESRLSFVKTLNDTGISLIGCDLPVELVLKMDLEGFAGEMVKPGVTPETLLATRGVAIFREVADWKLEEAKDLRYFLQNR